MKIFCKSGGFKGKTYTHLSGYGADGAVHHDSVRSSFTEEIFAAASDGVRRATKSVTLEERKNSGDSCGVGMPAVHVIQGEMFTVTVLPQGACSENMSQIKMMLPSKTENIVDFIVGVVRETGPRPRPPAIVGWRKW